MDKKHTDKIKIPLQEKQLVEFSKFTLETVLNNIDSIIYIANIESYKILFMNNYMKKILNSDFTGQICWESLIDNQDGPCKYCTNNMLIDVSGNSVGTCISELYNQKSKRWYETHNQAIPWSDGCLVRMTIAFDITQRKNTEKKLKESQEKYQYLSKMLRLMCDDVSDMIWAKDLNKKYIFANKAICQKLLNAVDTKEPIGKTDLFFAERERKRHPQNPKWHTFGELCQDSDTIVLKKGAPQQFDEFGNVKGKFFFLDVHKAPFIDDRGKTIGVVGSAHDVTDAKKLEKKLKKWNEALEEKIEQRTSTVKDVNTALKVLLKKREEDKNQIGENIFANFKLVIQPLLNQARKSRTNSSRNDILDILESNIKDMVTPLSRNLSDPIVGLTPTEVQVAMLVKDGKTNKESAQILNKSTRAISSHRNNIRQKLNLKHKKINLRTYLLSLD